MDIKPKDSFPIFVGVVGIVLAFIGVAVRLLR